MSALQSLGDDAGSCFLCALWLSAIMLGFDMSVEGRIGEVAFSATTEIVPTLFIFAGTSGG